MAYEEKDAFGKIWATKLTANDSTAQEELGSIRYLADGRAFRYIRLVGGACILGRVLMPAAKVTVTDATSSTTTWNGATVATITDADAAWTADDYIGWYFKVDTGKTGSEEPIKIVGNTATVLTLERNITTALTSAGTDDGEILAGKVAGVASTASDLDIACVGVGIGTITQNYYGWVQTKGVAAVLSTAALSEGDACSPGGGTTAGQAADRAGADDVTIGTTIAAGGANDYQMVYLNID